MNDELRQTLAEELRAWGVWTGATDPKDPEKSRSDLAGAILASVAGRTEVNAPRRFQLIRYRDVSGISGTGVVAEGVEFSDGTVAVRWPDHGGSTAAWPSIDGVIAVHGHSGASVIRWLDGEQG